MCKVPGCSADAIFLYLYLLLAVPDSQGVVTVDRGDTLILPCHMSPQSTVIWLHLEKPSIPVFLMYYRGAVDYYLQQRVNVSNPRAGDFSLIHFNIQKDDAGRYMCCQESRSCIHQKLQFVYTVYVNGMSTKICQKIKKKLTYLFRIFMQMHCRCCLPILSIFYCYLFFLYVL